MIRVAGEILMQIQVRLEEEHLWATLGFDYKTYRHSTARWLGRGARSPHQEKSAVE